MKNMASTSTWRRLIEGFPLEGGRRGRFEGLRPDQVALALPSGPRAASNGQASAAASTARSTASLLCRAATARSRSGPIPASAG